MILGYSISVPDNDYYMYDKLNLPACAKYMDVYSINLIDPTFKFKKIKMNISETWDGFLIVSDKFKQFCEIEKYGGLEFVLLPASPNFFWLKVYNIIEFDTEARKTEFIHFSKECNGYGGIYGATPACLKTKSQLGDNLYRSDISFGDYEKKSPKYLVGEKTKIKLKAAGFKEIYFKEIQDEYEWQKNGKNPNQITIK